MRLLFLIAIVTVQYGVYAQRPMPAGGPPPWAKIIDVDRSGKIEQEEFRAAGDAFFRKHDRNANGLLDLAEIPGRRPPGAPEGPRMPGPERQPMPMNEVPPFLFLERGEGDLTKARFDERSNLRFIEIDVNGDRAIDFEEIKAVRPDDRQPRDTTAMAKFIGAEMRFGDKQIKGAPFSAETVREESKRLFDGTLVKTESKGQIYRDREGRVRQELPFESINGFPVLGRDDQPLRLIHIVDPAAGKAVSLNYLSKTYFDIPFQKSSPLTPKDEPQDAKTESLGKQTVEGVTAEGTRTTIEIPVGRIGNDKPIFVVTERWFSPDLQMVVLSRHTDPFIGEVTFRLFNIKLGEPAADLFKVPADFKQATPERVRRPNREPRPDPDVLPGSNLPRVVKPGVRMRPDDDRPNRPF
jgi:hypothetical protein